MRIVTNTMPAELPLTWQSMKAYLSADDERDKTIVMDLVAEATDYAERQMNASLITRTITATFEEREPIYLPRGPVQSITSVRDSTNADVSYSRRDAGTLTWLELGGSSNVSYPLTVVYVAGYGTAADIPAAVRGMIRADAISRYEWRGSKAALSISDVWPRDEFYRQHGRGVPIT